MGIRRVSLDLCNHQKANSGTGMSCRADSIGRGGRKLKSRLSKVEEPVSMVENEISENKSHPLVDKYMVSILIKAPDCDDW